MSLSNLAVRLPPLPARPVPPGRRHTELTSLTHTAETLLHLRP
ncbi:hypothetical protein OG298_02820 [Streptomyces sp. NBC_01005]|nr:hypothetical protein OG298_02820 [Streptomyces sp. NBC_01005]WTC92859.1 hypothetical protein OH736_02805 [Streptomyces sp. NBC_01650]